MNFDLKSYVKIYTDQIDYENRSQIIEDLENTPWEKHTYSDPKDGTEISFDSDFKMTWQLIKWNEFVHKKIWNCINQYLIKDLDLYWYKAWNGFSQVRYNKYEVGTEMRLHCDHIHSMFDGNRKGVPILSVLGCLNDDYEGGELIMWENEIINLKAGDIMVFPSNFLYPHKVNPVTKGTRYSYVSWVW